MTINLLTMPSKSKPPELNTTDPGEMRQSLRLLDRSTSWFWWNTLIGLILLTAALVVLSSPEMLTRYALARQLNVNLLVWALLALMLIANIYTLYRQRHFELFRRRFTEQIQIAAEQRMRADKFYGMAILDPLTDLYNRRYGRECLQKEITRAERHSYDLAVIVLDLDNFKQINDKFGHAAGDEVLKEFSRRLKRAIRACDVPVRMGGDEFLVVLPECPRENVHIILSRLKPFEVILDRQKIPVSYSRGRAQFQVTDTPETLIQRADQLLYAEKMSRQTHAGPATAVIVGSWA
jgi:diguanylate cyclase (GGDEF)-like protein